MGSASRKNFVFPHVIWLNMVSVGRLICFQMYLRALIISHITVRTATGHSKTLKCSLGLRNTTERNADFEQDNFTGISTLCDVRNETFKTNLILQIKVI